MISKMSEPVDFIIYGHTDFPGMSVVLPRTGEAYDFMVKHDDMNVAEDGSSPLPRDLIQEFVEDAAWAKLTCMVV